MNLGVFFKKGESKWEAAANRGAGGAKLGAHLLTE